MRIRLKMHVPVGKEHGLTPGRELDTLSAIELPKNAKGAWVRSDTGVPVKLRPNEYEVVGASTQA